MDFIKKLPMSNSSDTILVIIDHLTKQSIFIPTIDTITSPMLAKLFILHVFSKHGVPSHVTSDRCEVCLRYFTKSLRATVFMQTVYSTVVRGKQRLGL